jgi:hypothetical protein
MRKKLFTPVTIAISFLLFTFSYAQDIPERKLVLRQAQESGNTTVAVEAYLAGDILEATVYARMYGAKPRIFNIILAGPKLGRLSPRSKETIYPKAEEEEEVSFPTTDLVGTIRFSKRTQEKAASGTLTRELSKFKVPAQKILPNKRYELRILVESMQNPGKTESFFFPLKDFDKLFL